MAIGANGDILTTQQTLSAAGAGQPIIFQSYQVQFNPATIIVQRSAGASLTYNVEVSGDDPTAPGYNAANGVWQPRTNFSGLTASAVGSLASVVNVIRVSITSYSSGTRTFQFIQYNRT